MSKTIFYAAACVLVPLAWGLLVYFVSSALERRIAKKDADSPKKPHTDVFPDYHI